MTRADGGWVVHGTKGFATSATGARWAILLVDPAGPGGARHARGTAAGLLLLACDLTDPAVTVDTSWWDPVGIRATVSRAVRFNGAFFPHDRLIGEPGSYPTGQWQTAFVPHYAASFLGAAEAAYDYAPAYLKHQGKSGDPYVQHRVGRMAVDVDTARLRLRHVAGLCDERRPDQARIARSRARHVIEQTVRHCIRACGARCLVRPSPVERILRDLTFYQRHDNDDHVLAPIGRAALGEPYDPSFHKT
ncbi:acyl-CoA dehydrogenase family protein [Streptomyces sp. NPDC058000]|uniref:acyl-CoA dehydrogenase family protein n=1 Tax=Streptomyces sp. NPDC058000 TaxID=3346299 RepID=UPI0036E5EF39